MALSTLDKLRDAIHQAASKHKTPKPPSTREISENMVGRIEHALWPEMDLEVKRRRAQLKVERKAEEPDGKPI
jgi:hypothetical protein